MLQSKLLARTLAIREHLVCPAVECASGWCRLLQSLSEGESGFGRLSLSTRVAAVWGKSSPSPSIGTKTIFAASLMSISQVRTSRHYMYSFLAVGRLDLKYECLPGQPDILTGLLRTGDEGHDFKGESSPCRLALEAVEYPKQPASSQEKGYILRHRSRGPSARHVPSSIVAEDHATIWMSYCSEFRFDGVEIKFHHHGQSSCVMSESLKRAQQPLFSPISLRGNVHFTHPCPYAQ